MMAPATNYQELVAAGDILLPRVRVATLKDPEPCSRCGAPMEIGTWVGWAPSTKAKFHAQRSQCSNHHSASNPHISPAIAPPVAQPIPAAGDAGAAIAALLAPHLQGALQAKVSADDVQAIVDAAVEELANQVEVLKAHVARLSPVTTVEVRNAETGDVRNIGVQHKSFPLLLKLMQAREDHTRYRLNIWLTGPTGSGKTTSAKKAAEALGLRFAFCGALDSEYKLLGFVNASGQVVDTEFKRFYTEGGVYLLDEVDSWLPSALLALNAALANGECAFPEGTLQRHPDFVCLAAANTWGTGEDLSDYVGRARLDAAFLARFPVKLNWDYDEDLERALVPVEYRFWADRVIKLRANAKRYQLKVIIHPRFTYQGAALLRTGMDQATVETITVRAGIKAHDWTVLNKQEATS